MSPVNNRGSIINTMKQYELNYYTSPVTIIHARTDDEAIAKAKVHMKADPDTRPWKLWDCNDQNILAFI